MTIESISPAKAKILVAQGAALIDIRERDEYARENIAQAHLLSLSAIENGDRLGPFDPFDTVIFHCHSGARTAQNAQKLVDAVAPAKVFLLEGGLNAWKKDGQEIHACSVLAFTRGSFYSLVLWAPDYCLQVSAAFAAWRAYWKKCPGISVNSTALDYG